MNVSALLLQLCNTNIELQDNFLEDVSISELNHVTHLYRYTLKKELIAWCRVVQPEIRDDKTGEVLQPRMFRWFSKDICPDDPLLCKGGRLLTLDKIREQVYCNPYFKPDVRV